MSTREANTCSERVIYPPDEIRGSQPARRNVRNLALAPEKLPFRFRPLSAEIASGSSASNRSIERLKLRPESGPTIGQPWLTLWDFPTGHTGAQIRIRLLKTSIILAGRSDLSFVNHFALDTQETLHVSPCVKREIAAIDTKNRAFDQFGTGL
jgi:hypothetical protein